MAENNIAGFKKLMRYAQNLAEYEQGIADGIIDENVFVIVLEEKVAKFKGETFDWSGGGSDVTVDSEMSDTSENPVQNKVVKGYVDEDAEVTAAALVDLDDRVNNLNVNTETLGASFEETNANLSGLTDEVAENEEVAAAALVDLKNQIKTHLNELQYDEQAIAAAFSDIKKELDDIKSDYASITNIEALSATLTEEFISNEQVIAEAFSRINSRLSTIEKKFDSLK